MAQSVLAARDESDAQIAERLRELDGELATRRETVWRWRKGHGTPDARARAALRDLYGIPVAAWDHRDGAAPPPRRAAAPSAPAEALAAEEAVEAPPSTASEVAEAIRQLGRRPTIEQIDAHLAQVRTLLAAPGIVEAAAARLHGEATKLLAQRRQIERDAEILEDRVINENPRFRKWKAAALELARDFPEAARRLVAIVRELDGAEAAE